MKTLILYASKYGATAECARLLAQELGPRAELHNLEEGAPDLAGADAVLVGGPIYAGMLRKPVKEFCKKQEAALLEKKLGLFLCCTTPAQAEDFLRQNLPAALLEHAGAKENLGGVLPTGKVRAMDKMILSMVAKSRQGQPPPALDREAIHRLAAAMA